MICFSNHLRPVSPLYYTVYTSTILTIGLRKLDLTTISEFLLLTSDAPSYPMTSSSCTTELLGHYGLQFRSAMLENRQYYSFDFGRFVFEDGHEQSGSKRHRPGQSGRSCQSVLLELTGTYRTYHPPMPFSLLKKHTPSNSVPAIGPASHSQPVYPWSAHTLTLVGHSPSPFPRSSHALSTTATAASELFLFGGNTHGGSPRDDLYVFSTRDFSTTLLRTSGETPSPRCAHGAALTSTLLLVWGGFTNFSRKSVQNEGHDDSLYFLNLGTSDLLMSTPAPADQSFLLSSIARVDPRRGQWSPVRSLLPYHDFGWFEALRFRWPNPWGFFK